MKAFNLLLSVLFLFSMTVFGTVLGDLTAGMNAGDWRMLNSPTFDYDLNYDCTNTAPHFITEYTDDAMWDPASRQVLFIGAGHGCKGKFISYSDETNTWREEPYPSVTSDMAHAYDHNAIDRINGVVYHRRHGQAEVYRYNIAQQQWSKIPSLPSSAANPCCAAMEYFPEMQSLFYAYSGGLVQYTESSNKWTSYGSYPSGSIHNFAKYNPVHKCVIFGGGNDSRDVYKIDRDGSVSKMKPAPFQLRINVTVITPGPVSGDFIVLNDDKTLWVYDVVSDTWTQQSGTAPIFSFGKPTFKTVATYIDNYGVILYAKNDMYVNRVIVYKHAASSPVVKGYMERMDEDGLQVMPNPFYSTVNIAIRGNMAKRQGGRVSILDIQGKIVKSFKLTVLHPASYAWNTSGYPSGIYMVNMTAGDRVLTKRITLQK
jgi:hypothetical protein